MRRLRRGQTLDAAIFVAGVGVSLLLSLPWLRHPGGFRPVDAVVAVTVIVLAQFPLELTTRAGEVVIGFEASALVYLSLTTSTAESMALWLIAMLLAHGRMPRKNWNDRLFNVGCTTLAGAIIAVTVGHGHARPEFTQLALVAGSCAAYFVVDLILTACSLAAGERTRLTSAVPLRSAPLPFAAFLGIDTLGYLAALLSRAYSAWSLLLLLVPLGTILVAARAVTRERDGAARTSALFTLAQAAAQDSGTADIVGMLVDQLSALLPNRGVEVRSTAPGTGEVGAALRGPDGIARFLVVTPGQAGPAFREYEETTVRALAAVASDSLERQRLVAETSRMARFDPLTGLANRTTFIDRLEHALHRLRRTSGMVSVLYCDLDGFKRVNDRFGHAAGDAVLQEVGDRLRATVRAADTAARFGGDEFAVLVEGMESGGEAAALADRLIAVMAKPFFVSGRSVPLGVSIGLAATTGDADAETLLQDADVAMYRAKAGGKSRAETFVPQMRQEDEHRIRIEDALRNALSTDELRLALQPVVELETGRLDGFEALLRWSHPVLGQLPPDVFIPVAEQAGLMLHLGRWVLAEARAHGFSLADAIGAPVTLGINVAAEQLRDTEFLESAAAFASDGRVRLVLELTERALVEEAAAATALREMSDAGAVIAIDDFGIGYSSISYLHQFDCINIVKIDRSFVRTVRQDFRAVSLVESIVGMAHAFGSVVVAEGVEDVQTAEVLQTAGCELAQGFLYSPAVPFLSARQLLLEQPFSGVSLPASITG